MEENVLYNPNQVNQSNTPIKAAGPSQPISEQKQSQVVPPPVPPPPPLTSAPPPISQRPRIIGVLVKLIIAIVVLGGLGFMVFQFVLPMFLGGNGNEKVSLTYWGLWEPEGVMQTVIDDFEKDHKNISVTYEKRDIDRYRQTLQTRVLNGDGPDVFLYHNTWTPIFTSILSPLSQDVISPSEFEEVYYPVIQKDLVRKGAIYGIPSGIDTLALFVNNSIFDETGAKVPKTWEDFTNVSAGVTVREGENEIKTYGVGFGSYDNVNRASDILAMLFAQSSVSQLEPEGSKQQMSEALQFYTDFVTGKDDIEVAWSQSAPNAVIAFAGGNVAMYLGYSWDVFTIKELNPSLDFSIYPVPTLKDDITVASYWVNGISNKSLHQEAAQEFMSYLAKKETQEKLYTETSKTRLFGLPPARRDMASLVSDNPLVAPFVNQAENATSSYFASDTFDEGLNEQMNTYLGNAVRSILGNTSAESATDTLVSGIDQVLSQYGLK